MDELVQLLLLDNYPEAVPPIHNDGGLSRNLIEIPINYNKAKVGSPNVFVPSLLLSNVMSLAPKIDEVRNV